MGGPNRKPREPATQVYTVETYRAEESLGFLLGRCVNRISEAIDLSLEALGINSQHFGILHAVLNGRAKNPSDLARLRYRHSAAITYTLDVLEEKKLLIRKRSAHDRRSVELELTEEGKKLTRACIPLVVAAQNELLEGLTLEEYHTLSALLRRIARREYATAPDRSPQQGSLHEQLITPLRSRRKSHGSS